MSYQIEWGKNGVVVEFEGATSIESIDEAGQDVYKDPRLSHCSFILFNFDLADLSEITLEQIRGTADADHNRSLEFPNPVLIIVSNQPIADALVFHYKLSAESSGVKWEIKLFGSSKEAFQWCRNIA